MLKEKWKTHYHGPCSREEELQAFYITELSEEELSPGEKSDEGEDNDYYVDLTGLIMDLQAAERKEYGKSNLKSDHGFDEALKKHPAELQGLLRKHKVVFGPLTSPGACKKLIQMDLEVTDKHKNSTLTSRPIALNEEDEKQTMRQIYECCDAKLMSRYEGKEFPKHCSPCFLVAKPGSSAKRLVVHYAKLNERLKRHSDAPHNSGRPPPPRGRPPTTPAARSPSRACGPRGQSWAPTPTRPCPQHVGSGPQQPAQWAGGRGRGSA